MILKLIWLIALVLCDGLSLVQPEFSWGLLDYSCKNRYETENAQMSCLDEGELEFEASYGGFRCPFDLPFDGLGYIMANDHKPTIWVHIHKTGGTTICATALENGEKVIEPFANCNWKPFDDEYPPANTVFPSCDSRKRSFEEQHATWGQFERDFYPSDICPEKFNYGIMLRDPIALTESHFNYEYDLGKSTLTDYKVSLECAESGGEICQQSKFDWFMYFDNWLIRKLMGKGSQAEWRPGTITQRDAQQTVERLTEFFNVVTILEHEQETIQILNHAFGWKMRMKHLNKVPKAIEFTATEQNRMRQLMKYDYMVYDHMRKLPAGTRGASI